MGQWIGINCRTFSQTRPYSGYRLQSQSSTACCSSPSIGWTRYCFYYFISISMGWAMWTSWCHLDKTSHLGTDTQMNRQWGMWHGFLLLPAIEPARWQEKLLPPRGPEGQATGHAEMDSRECSVWKAIQAESEVQHLTLFGETLAPRTLNVTV